MKGNLGPLGLLRLQVAPMIAPTGPRTPALEPLQLVTRVRALHKALAKGVHAAGIQGTSKRSPPLDTGNQNCLLGSFPTRLGRAGRLGWKGWPRAEQGGLGLLGPLRATRGGSQGILAALSLHLADQQMPRRTGPGYLKGGQWPSAGRQSSLCSGALHKVGAPQVNSEAGYVGEQGVIQKMQLIPCY